MNTYYFLKDKTAVLGAIKAQLPFSEGKYQLLNSGNRIPTTAIFYHLNFQLPHPNRTDSAVLVICAGFAGNTLRRRRSEARLIFRHETMQPKGMNVDFAFV